MSGGGATTTSTQSIPSWLQNYGQGYLSNAAGVAQTPYTAYTGQRVADMSPLQQRGLQGLWDQGGSQTTQDAQNMLSSTMRGEYGNPYTQGIGSGGQYQFGATGGGANPYGGENPYFQESLRGQLNDITDAYNKGVSADTTRMFNLAGAFGGSAHQNTVANNERELGRTLGNVTNQAYQQQYDRSAGLAESGLNRDQGARQFDANLGNSAFENAANRGIQTGTYNNNLGYNAYEAERARQLQAAGLTPGINAGERQGYLDQIQGGDLERRYMQSLLDSAYGDFNEWRQYPEHQLDVFGRAFGSLYGGAPRSTTTQGPGSDPLAQSLGAWQLSNQLGSKGGNGFSGAYGSGDIS